MPANNLYQNVEGCAQDLDRYNTIIKQFEDNSYRIVQNVKYLKSISKSLDIISLRNTKERAPEFWLIPAEYKERINKLLKKDKQNLKKKLNSIEASREKKKVNIVSQWIGDLI